MAVISRQTFPRPLIAIADVDHPLDKNLGCVNRSRDGKVEGHGPSIVPLEDKEELICK